MCQDRTSCPLVVGIGAGVLIGIAAAVYVYTTRHDTHEARLRDAKDIIEQCHRQIEEIEKNLAILKNPVAA